MNIKKIITVILFLHTSLIAQKLEFGKVSKYELEETIHPLDSSANAAILFKKARTHFYYTEKTILSLILRVFQKDLF